MSKDWYKRDQEERCQSEHWVPAIASSQFQASPYESDFPEATAKM